MILLTADIDGYAQFITVLVIFVVVLGVTALTTRWLANYQKQQSVNENVQVIETTRIANNKYVQIIRVGETYMAIAVCKDTVTMLGEIPVEQLKSGTQPRSFQFKDFFDKAMMKGKADCEEPKENHFNDEQKI
jgi:flagellar protein FliO/FliZ